MTETRADELELPGSYGAVAAEYGAFRDACALVSRADRGVVRVTGDRAAEMVNGLVSQDVRGLQEAGRLALLLNAKGRVLADLRVFPEPGGLLLDVADAGRSGLLATFEKYLPPIYAEHEDLSDRYRQIGVYGPDSIEVVRAVLGQDPPARDLGLLGVEREGAQFLVVRNRRLGGEGAELIGPEPVVRQVWGDLDEAVRSAGGRPAGREALEIVRVESGIPRYGQDMSEDNLAQETGLEDEAISYEKGCYLGQEVVARIHYRGHVNRMLRGLRFEEVGPAPGARLYREEKEVGEVTSSVSSPSLGAIGLGYVRREVEPPAALEWRGEHGDSGPVTVTKLPFRQTV